MKDPEISFGAVWVHRSNYSWWQFCSLFHDSL